MVGVSPVPPLEEDTVFDTADVIRGTSCTLLIDLGGDLSRNNSNIDIIIKGSISGRAS